jgi:hypothetical protein
LSLRGVFIVAVETKIEISIPSLDQSVDGTAQRKSPGWPAWIGLLVPSPAPTAARSHASPGPGRLADRRAKAVVYVHKSRNVQEENPGKNPGNFDKLRE